VSNGESTHIVEEIRGASRGDYRDRESRGKSIEKSIGEKHK
jgi:hypothetical protein